MGDETDKIKDVVEKVVETKKKHSTLTKQTMIPLGLVITIVVACASGYAWLQHKFTEVGYKFTEISHEFEKINLRIHEDHDDPVEKADFAHWVALFRAMNEGKGITVPEVR